MKYFLDAEFIEGSQDTGWSFRTKPTIDLISIGIVAEDGREYYAISNEFNLKEAWNRCDIKRTKTGNNPYRSYWLRDNILKSIHYELASKEVSTPSYDTWLEVITLRENGVYGDRHYKTLKKLINKYGKSNKQIAEEVIKFTSTSECRFVEEYGDKPEFYGYYADYDWVVFCWLFGKMIDLPQGFPMYCIDLKQELENMISIMTKYNCSNPITLKELHILSGKNITFGDAEKIDWNKWFKEHPNYPKQTNEHNALADARWNYELYKFLNTI